MLAVDVLVTEREDELSLCLEVLDDACVGVESRLSADRAPKLLLISIYIDELTALYFEFSHPQSVYRHLPENWKEFQNKLS